MSIVFVEIYGKYVGILWGDIYYVVLDEISMLNVWVRIFFGFSGN